MKPFQDFISDFRQHPDRNLSINYPSLTIEEVKELAALFRDVPEIRVVTISTKLDYEMVKILAEALPKSSIYDLELYNNGIDPAGAAAIAAVLSQTQIEHFSLEGNDIGDEGAAAIAAVLPACSVCINVNLRGTKISDKGIKALVDVLPRTRLIGLGTSNNELVNDKARQNLLQALEFNGNRVEKLFKAITFNDYRTVIKLLNENVCYRARSTSGVSLHFLCDDRKYFIAQLLLHDAYKKGYIKSLLRKRADNQITPKDIILASYPHSDTKKIIELLEVAEIGEPMLMPDMANAPHVFPYLHIDTKYKTFDQIMAEIGENPEAYTGTLDLSRIEINAYGFDKLCDLLPKTQFSALSFSLFSLSDDMTRISVGNILKNTRSIIQMDLKLTIMNLVVVCNLIDECKRLGSNLVKLNVSCVKINDAVINRERDFNLLNNLVEFTATNFEGESLFYPYEDKIKSVLENGRNLAKQLYDAAEAGDVYKVKKLLDRGVSPCSRYAKKEQKEYGCSVLDIAVDNHNFLLVQLLLHRAQKNGYFTTLYHLSRLNMPGDTSDVIFTQETIALLEKAMAGEIIEEPLLPLFQEVEKPATSPGIAPEPIIEIAAPVSLYNQLLNDVVDEEASVDSVEVDSAAPVISTLLSNAADATANVAADMLESVFTWWTIPAQKSVPVAQDPETVGLEMQVRGAAPLLKTGSSGSIPS